VVVKWETNGHRPGFVAERVNKKIRSCQLEVALLVGCVVNLILLLRRAGSDQEYTTDSELAVQIDETEGTSIIEEEVQGTSM
jgi:hypothetical protein